MAWEGSGARCFSMKKRAPVREARYVMFKEGLLLRVGFADLIRGFLVKAHAIVGEVGIKLT